MIDLGGLLIEIASAFQNEFADVSGATMDCGAAIGCEGPWNPRSLELSPFVLCMPEHPRAATIVVAQLAEDLRNWLAESNMRLSAIPTLRIYSNTDGKVRLGWKADAVSADSKGM